MSRGQTPRLVTWSLLLVLLCVGVVVTVEVGLRARRAWVAAHLQVPPSEDPRFVADRLLRYKNRPTYQYTSEIAAQTDITYTNNALGLRGPEIAQPKPAGLKRVVLVGGSTVYGAMVDDTQTISVHVEQILRQRYGSGIQVINAGTPGYDALHEMVIARADLFSLEPDVLIALDGLNDVFYGSLEEWPSQVAADEIGILSDGRFPDVVAMVDATMFPHGLIEHQVTMLGRSLRQRGHSLLHLPRPAAPRIVNERVIALHARSLAMLATHGRQSSTHVVAALQPLVSTGHKALSEQEKAAVDYEGYWSVGNWPEIAQAFYPRLASTTDAEITSAGGRFVDLSAAFDDESDTTYASDAVHYTPLGNRRLAEALATLVAGTLGDQPSADEPRPAAAPA